MARLSCSLYCVACLNVLIYSAGTFSSSCEWLYRTRLHPWSYINKYSPSFYRATWIITGLDAGFATAMSIRPKWLRDICSIIFSVYYIIHANYADEKVGLGNWIQVLNVHPLSQLRRFRAVPTVEMLRATWEKTSHPFVCAIYTRSFASLNN